MTDEIVREPPVPQLPPKTNRLSLVVAIVLVSFISGAAGFFVAKSPAVPTALPNSTVTQTQTPEPVVDPDAVFISSLPNFDNLTIADLPNLRDTRGIFAYNSQYIVAGINRIVWYDPSSDKVVKMNNPDVLPCIYNTVLRGDYLYVACQSGNPFDNGKVVTPATLQRINLKTNRNEGNLLTDGKQRTNITLALVGNNIWIGSWDGLERMDLESGTIVENITVDRIGYPGCRIDRAYVKNNQLKVKMVDGTDCAGGGTAVYDQSQQTWTKGPDTIEAVQEVNSSPRVLGNEMPFYLLVSNNINGIRYLFTQDAYYTVRRGEMPQKQASFTSVLSITSEEMDTDRSKYLWVSPDGVKAIIFAPMLGPGPWTTLADLLPIYSITLTDGNVTNLTSGYTHPLTPAELELLSMYGRGEIKIITNDKRVQLVSTASNAPVLTVDTDTLVVSLP